MTTIKAMEAAVDAVSVHWRIVGWSLDLGRTSSRSRAVSHGFRGQFRTVVEGRIPYLRAARARLAQQDGTEETRA